MRIDPISTFASSAYCLVVGSTPSHHPFGFFWPASIAFSFLTSATVCCVPSVYRWLTVLQRRCYETLGQAKKARFPFHLLYQGANARIPRCPSLPYLFPSGSIQVSRNLKTGIRVVMVIISCGSSVSVHGTAYATSLSSIWSTHKPSKSIFLILNKARLTYVHSGVFL